MAEPSLSLAAADLLGFLEEKPGGGGGGQVSHSPLLLLEPGGGGGSGELEERGALLSERFFQQAVESLTVDVVEERDTSGLVVGLLGQKEGAQQPPGSGGGGDEAKQQRDESQQQAMPAVSALKRLFQRADAEAPQAPGGGSGSANKAAPEIKPCMLPVRWTPQLPTPAPPRAAAEGAPAEQQQQQQPAGEAWLQAGSSLGRSPYSRRRLEEPPGAPAQSLVRRVSNHSKAPKAGDEGDCAAPVVPLEAAEHEWLVKATAGQWSQRLHGLLLRDKSLAGKKDFMSGFTVLHWAAKAGNCDTLSKITEVAERGGALLNVNAQSHGGYTPLHIAAIHGQEDVIVQLVKDYGAKVNLRDYSGRKPYQYLKEGSSFAVRHLLQDPSLHTRLVPGGHTCASMKKNAKVAASILTSTSTFLGVLSEDAAFSELTKGLKKPASLNKLLHLNATAVPRRKLKSRGTFSSSFSLSAAEEDQEEVTVRRRPVSEVFFGH